MRYTLYAISIGRIVLRLFHAENAYSQTCGPDGVIDTSSFSGTAFFNYGSSARIKSQQYRSSVAVGQTFVGYLDGLMYNTTLGFYSRYLLAPFALSVTATQAICWIESS
ncbi:MAG: hypothetical protein IPH31_25130 [Lewinellaceae bacterium]|nr:hypothetical protein [Lewinellaceae bacterium]